MAKVIVLGAAKLVNNQWQAVEGFKKMGKYYVACQLEEGLVEPTEQTFFEKIAIMPVEKSPFTMAGTCIGVIANEGMLKTQKKLVMYSVLYKIIEENKTEITAQDIASFDSMFAEEEKKNEEVTAESFL